MCITSSPLLREWNFLFDLRDDISFIALNLEYIPNTSGPPRLLLIYKYQLWELVNGTGTTTLPNRWSVPEHRGEVGLLPHFCQFGHGGWETISLPSGSLNPTAPTPTPCLQGEPGQMGSVFDKEPLHPCFNALLLHFKSSTVFSKCWNWQLCQSLATLNNPPFKSGSPNPDSVESCDGAHRGRPLCPPLCGG